MSGVYPHQASSFFIFAHCLRLIKKEYSIHPLILSNAHVYPLHVDLERKMLGMNNDPTHPFQVPPPPPPPPHASMTHAQITPSRPSRFAPRAWYRKQSKKAQGDIGCFTLLVALLLCFMCASASEDTSSDNSLAQQSSSSPAVKVQYKQTKPTIPSPAPTPKPSPTPTPKPTPTPVLVTTGMNGNPWGYDFNPGTEIYNPNPDFCSYFHCISNFWNGAGYVVQCGNGHYNKSGGRRGACSRDGGVAQTLYQH